MSGLKRVFNEVYSAGYRFLDGKKERATEFTNNNAGLHEMFDNFHNLLMERKDELVNYFSTRSPANYGNYGEV
jgi:hypothetical protein